MIDVFMTPTQSDEEFSEESISPTDTTPNNDSPTGKDASDDKISTFTVSPQTTTNTTAAAADDSTGKGKEEQD